MATCISHSPAETAALGEQWGRTAESGLVIGLSGDLGAGKTQFVKGLARGLDIKTRVHSPTFALVNIYSGGRLTLFHLDLYRLDTTEQIAAAGLEEYLRPAGVTVIEWAERWFGELQSPESAATGYPAHPDPTTGVRPSSGAAGSGPHNTLGSSGTPPSACVAAPGDGRTPIPSSPLAVPGPNQSQRLRRILIEVLSATERRITYEDSGA